MMGLRGVVLLKVITVLLEVLQNECLRRVSLGGGDAKQRVSRLGRMLLTPFLRIFLAFELSEGSLSLRKANGFRRQFSCSILCGW